MRVFFGLDPSGNCKRRIEDWRDRFVQADGRPVPAANFHITLAFVGDIDYGPLERLCDAVDTWMTRAQPTSCEVTLDRVGYFAGPAIFWVGPTHIPDTLRALAQALQQRALSAGARRDTHEWVPHVTLYRRCVLPPPVPLTNPDFTLAFDHMTLFESRAGNSGVRYTPLAEWELARG